MNPYVNLNLPTSMAGLIAGTWMAISAPAAAQAVTPDDTASNPQLTEVVVTAERRKENIQNVPISAQVVGGTTLTSQNLNSLVDLGQTVPSLHISPGAASADMYIRGIGSGAQQSFDQSVGTFIDDIYYGRARMSADTFLDVARVEVLKGPQTTFFGNNAIAGALNIVTNEPTDYFDASARALYGTDGQYAAEGVVSGPLNQVVAVRVAAIVDGGAGWIKDVATGRYGPSEYDDAGRVTLAFHPGSKFDATLKVEAAKDQQSGDLDLQLLNCPPKAPFTAGAFCQAAVTAGVPSYSPNHVGTLEADAPGQGTFLSTEETELTASYHGWADTLSSVTGYYRYNYNQNLELDVTPVPGATVAAPEQYDQFSQELRLTSPSNETIEYLLGAYLQIDHLTYQQDNNFPFLSPTFESIPAFSALDAYLPVSQDFDYSQPEHVYSVFGSASWNVTKRWKLTAGLRGESDEKTFLRTFDYGTATRTYGGDVPLPPTVADLPEAALSTPPGSLSGDREDRDWMPSANVQYRFDREAMGYFSFSQGFKAGGFNGSDTTGSAANMPFQPEHVNAYELGIKSRLLDDTLLLNLDVFRSDYRNLQVVVEEDYSTGNGVAVVRNAASSRSQGIEYQGEWVASRHLRFGADLTYLSSRYVSYPNAAPTALEQVQGFGAQNLSGLPTEYAPLWSGSLSGTFETSLSNGLGLSAVLMPYFTSSYYVLSSEDAASQQPQYVRLDARLSLESPDGHWGVDLIGKNLTDRQVVSFATIAPTSPGSYFVSEEERRNVAIQVRYHW